MSDNNQRFKMPWSIFTHAKFNLTGEEWKENPGNRPTLKFKIHENNPRFNLYLNDGKYKKSIAFALDPQILQELFEVLRIVIKDPEPSRYYHELKSSYDHRGNKSEKAGPVSKIFVGRDSEGVVYIAFQAKGESLAKFPFKPNYWALLHDSTGEQVSPKFASEVRAKAWMNALDKVVGPYMAVHGKEPAQKPGSGGGSNKSGSWGKSDSQAPKNDDWGEDVDM